MVKPATYHVSYSPAGDRSALPIVYDLHRSSIDRDLTAYGAYLLRRRYLKPNTVQGVVYQIARFKAFLSVGGVPRRIDDNVLLEFREQLFVSALARARRSDERTAKITVNAALEAIYPWLRWMQETRRVEDGLVGEFPAAVVSEPVQTSRSGHRWTMPLRYERVGKNSKHKLPAFVPGDQTLTELLEDFHATTTSQHIAQRNSLILRIADSMGLRRGSICSLTVEQFARTRLEKCKTQYVDVRPARQKFSYRDVFHCDLGLAYEINSFIENERAQLVVRKGWQDTGDALLLSERTGRQITEGAVTKVFSAAMRARGAPPGAALHAWRHRFTHNEIDHETRYRVAAGLDTSVASISAAVSLRLGHSNPGSIDTYVTSAQSRTALRDPRQVTPKSKPK